MVKLMPRVALCAGLLLLFHVATMSAVEPSGAGLMLVLGVGLAVYGGQAMRARAE